MTIRSTAFWTALAVVIAVAASAMAQPPAVDIYIAPFSEVEGSISVGQPVNATSRPGYDNQPSFNPAGTAFLYSSQDSSGQVDVFRYELATGAITRVTDTPESEYSPTILPGGGGFSTVRVEGDGTQRLWRFDLDGSNSRVVLADVDSVGYHAWADANTVVLFILGQPHSLRMVDTREGDEQIIATDVGRAVSRIPGTREVCFTRRVGGDQLWLCRLERPSLRTPRMFRALEGSEDYAYTPSGVVLMAVGSSIYRRDDGNATGWSKVVVLEGMDGITRMVVSPGGTHIAFVATDS